MIATAIERAIVSLQSLDFPPSGYFFVCLQHQSLVAVIMGRSSEYEIDFDTRGFLDTYSPNPADLEAGQDRVDVLLTNRKPIPSHAFK